MEEGIKMTVQNQLVAGKRDLNAYHHADRGAYLISHGNTVTVPLGAAKNGDYLHLSIVIGPGDLETDCWINLPSWCDFAVSGLGSGDIVHSGGCTLLRVPPGPPVWQLKITRPAGQTNTPAEDYIAVGDREQGSNGHGTRI